MSWELQAKYGRTWETESGAETREEAEELRADYIRNAPEHEYRIRRAKVAKPTGTYKIVRMFENDDVPSQVIRTGLTLEEAQAHCNDPETSSKTSTKPLKAAKGSGWFDGWQEETVEVDA